MAKHSAYYTCDRCGRKTESRSRNDISVFVDDRDQKEESFNSVILSDVCRSCTKETVQFLQNRVR